MRASRTAAAALALLVATASATHVGHTSVAEHFGDTSHHRDWRHHDMGFMHRHGWANMRRHLRICNAYPDSRPLDVSRGSRSLLSDGAPLKYKSCRDFLLMLKVGDKIQFKLDGNNAGIFVVQALPADDAVLMLVIQRHDTVSTAVSFQSHIFSASANAQVAVIDAYKGGARSTASISDKRKDGHVTKSQMLRYSSLVALGQGTYGVDLVSNDGRTLQTSDMVALDRESYVILRTGIDPEDGEPYPQELVVYPHSELPQVAPPKPNAAYVRPWLCGLLVAVLNGLALAA